MNAGFYWMVDAGSKMATIVYVSEDESVHTSDGEVHHLDEFRSNNVVFQRVDKPVDVTILHATKTNCNMMHRLALGIVVVDLSEY